MDVHVFVEGAGEVARDEVGQRGVFLHRNLLSGMIPDRLPASERWPRITYARIFAPCLLASYDRLIYLDADIYPTVAAPELLRIALPGGLGVVQDAATIGAGPRGISRRRSDWLAGIGLQTDRYFNSGMLLIDRAAWIANDFSDALVSFMSSYGDRVFAPDQDFLNHHFQNRWTELSPRFNYQKAHFNYGYEALFQPVFLHFSSQEKPWHRETKADTAHSQFFAPYRDMLEAEGIDHRKFMRSRRESTVRMLRGQLRSWLTRLGARTGKERRQRQDWQRRADWLYRAFQEDAAANRYADMTFTLRGQPRPALSFDGTHLGRELDIAIAPMA